VQPPLVRVMYLPARRIIILLQDTIHHGIINLAIIIVRFVARSSLIETTMVALSSGLSVVESGTSNF
jgi:hypothetical protein